MKRGRWPGKGPPSHQTIKSFTRFFSKNRGVQRQRLWSPVATDETPARRSVRNTLSSPSAIRRWRNLRGCLRRPHGPTATPVGVDGGGHLFFLAQGPASLTAPDGIRSGRVKDAVSYQLGTHSPRHGDHRFPNPHGRTAPYGLRGGYVIGRGTRHKAAVHHPLTGCGRRPSALPGIAPSADGASGRWGISRRARRGCFARCDGRPGLCPWTPEFFREKIQ